MDQDLQTVVLPGAGTLTRVPDGVVLAGPAGGVRPVLAAVGATAGLPAAARCTALGEVVGATPGLALVLLSGTSTLTVLGSDLQLRGDHIGYRVLRPGPTAIVLDDCTAVAVVPPTTSWSPPRDAPPLHAGVRSAAGLWVAIIPTTGFGHDVVEGLLCSCGAFLNPMALRCRSCGTVVGTPRPTGRQPRVPVCRLVVDDGRTIAVDGPVVIGREPHLAEEVQQGTAHPLVLTDSQRSVSRVHAVLHVEGWDLVLEERRSSNGVSVRSEDVGDWTPLERGARMRVLPGTAVALGRRTVRVLG